MKIEIEIDEINENLFRELKIIIEKEDSYYKNLNLKEFIQDFYSNDNISDNLSELIESYK